MSPLTWAHPVVRDWFVSRFETPTEPQEQGWPHILAGHDVLVSAPTGSGKTLAAFLACIDQLVRRATEGTLADETAVVYVSPLKALGNDIQKNLDGPLAEIVAIARDRGLDLPDIRTAVRTGDTLAPAREAMLRKPPHILVTTPESLYLLLTSRRGRNLLQPVQTVIVDEIHAVADDKRGSHLALSLERLDALVGRQLPRIGLSATQKPIELVGQFLSGAKRPAPVIVHVPRRRAFDLAVEVPPSELGPIVTHELWGEIYDRLATLVGEHRSTIVFVNTRRLSERIAHHLAERLGDEAVAAHHGSLARRTRLVAEQRLKNGELKVLVATASLELGIDVGTVDLVCQIGSPRSISATVQRIGRAGHWRGATPKGRIFATTRDELVECAALVLAMRRGELDRLVIPEAPLDILAQQIVAACAAEDWEEDALFDLVGSAYPYRSLPRDDFDTVVAMLSDGIAAARGRYGAYLHRDRVNGRLRGRRGARIAALTGGGAIPDNALYTVVAEPDGTVVGTVDEDFAVESSGGDVFLLGNTSWRIRRIMSGRVLVEDARGAAPNVPFWRGEAPARTIELSGLVAEVRRQVCDSLRTGGEAPGDERCGRPAIDWLTAECGLDRAGAEQLVAYIGDGLAVLGDVPTLDTVIAERFFDEGGGMQLVIHAPFGGRINRAWGLALRKRFCRSFNFELQAAATDNAVNIALAEQHSFPLDDVFRYLSTATVREVLEQAALPSPIFGARWRWDATRSLALQRFRNGRKVPVHLQRMRADDLLAAVFPEAAACQENIEGDITIPDHPLIREVMNDVLFEAMDLAGLEDVLTRIKDGRIRCLAVDTPVASPFSHEILNANPYAYLDDAPLEERRARAVELRRVLPESVLSEVGRLDPAAIEEVTREAWPDVRDADDLADALHTLVVLPEGDGSTWTEHFDALVSVRRAVRARTGGRTFWVAAERATAVETLAPDTQWEPPPPALEVAPMTREEVLLHATRGWLGHLGPTSASALAARLSLPVSDVESALLRLESEGSILRGRFTPDKPVAADIEWCDRRLLARIHRLTLGKLRKEIEPVTAADFMRWLIAWQHAEPGTQVVGERGLLDVLRQLQGFEAPASAWESQILRRRVLNYDPTWLDRLCLTGAVGWGRLSPHPAVFEVAGGTGRRVVPTSAAPITFFVRDEADWMAPRGVGDALKPGDGPPAVPGLSKNAGAVLAWLHRSGASFFADIVRGVKQLKAEVESALWELVAAGLVTADGFDNLRALIDPRRRAGEGRGRTARPRHSTGRWSLLHTSATVARPEQLEATCRMLLTRYGVVFRELLARESLLPTWRELLVTFRRLEDRGEVRGGRFVSGLVGEQFALPVAVESLRASRRRPRGTTALTLSAADPLNLVGIILPGERVPAISGRTIDLGVAGPTGVTSAQGA